MQCIECGGNGCPTCDDRGKVKLTVCPLSLVTDDVWRLAAEVTDAEAGHLPNAGGMNDQPDVWVKASRQMRSEKAQWKDTLTPKDSDV